MRSLQLQSALTGYLQGASELLDADLAAGAEIPFELGQQGARSRNGGPALYCYRPLIEEFLAERRPALEALSGYAEAERLLGGFDGLDRYLVGVGAEIARVPRAARVRMAVGSLLGEVFAEQSDFELRPERVQGALERLEGSALASTHEVTLVATLHGVTLTSPELALTAGLTIAHPEALDGLPPGAVEGSEYSDEHLVVVLSAEDDDPRLALQRSEEVLRDLLRALRLFGDGRVTFGALAWARIAVGQWSAIALGAGGRPHGMLVVTTEQEDELRAFCNLVSRRAPAGNELAWALKRFELGCERESPFEALSDNLLALRALLEPEGPASGLLAGRLAALCATADRRLALTERTIQAISLEGAVISGTATAHAGAQAIADDLADNLRALLRDVICGHLAPDLVGLADELLLADPETAGGPDAPAPSAEQLLGDPGEAQEILDLFI
jgi:hypothetical protein